MSDENLESKSDLGTKLIDLNMAQMKLKLF